MTGERKNRRIARWGVPIGAIVATGAVAAGYALAGGPAAPVLPSRTTAQLLASVNAAPSAPPMTATITETAALGLPSLPNVGTGRYSNPMSPLTWLSGTHTIRLWYTDPAHVRVAAPVPMGEADVRRDGRDVWTWDSRNSHATHVILPAAAARQPTPDTAGATFTPTPEQAAHQLLKAVGPTTRIGLQKNVTVAGQPAYQLSLAPKASGSLIGQIRIAIAANRALPLRVQVFARGASSPAFQLGYTAVQFGTPAASNYHFTPPPGAKVKTVTVPAHRERPLPRGAVSYGWSGMAGSRTKITRIRLHAAVSGRPATAHRIRLHALVPPQRMPGTVIHPSGPVPGLPGPLPGATTLGKDWTAVLVLPAPGLAALTAPGGMGINPGGPMRGPASSGPVSVKVQRIPVGSAPAVIAALMRAATPVHGTWGSGRLLTTSLVNVLVTNGRVLIGAVTPAVLYADAAQLRNHPQLAPAPPRLAQPPKTSKLQPASPPKPASGK